jgi:fatty acid desaturase
MNTNTPSTHPGRPTRTVAWPTVALAAVVLLGAATVVSAAATGLIPLGLGSLVMTLLLYVAFTPMHEAVHQNISGGAKAWRWLDPLIGWLMSLLFASPLPAFRAVHLRHHGRTNHADDPDLWVAGGNPLTIALRCMTIVAHYDYVYFTRLRRANTAARSEGHLSIVALLAVVAAAAFVIWQGHGGLLLALWVGPLWLAAGMLAFAFDWLPHVPHQRIGRYVDTRAIDIRALDVPLLGQNLHSVHHLYPRVPFYRYRSVFEATAAEAEANGTVIVRGLSGAGARALT